MEDYEKEDIYYKRVTKEDLYIKESYNESLNVMSLEGFVESIKNSGDNIPFIEVCNKELDGWTRYFGMDDKSIYFRTKDFKSGTESYYMVDKSNFIKEKIESIDLKPYEGNWDIYEDELILY